MNSQLHRLARCCSLLGRLQKPWPGRIPFQTRVPVHIITHNRKSNQTLWNTKHNTRL